MINVYEMVTNRIIAEMEKGIVPWRKPWAGTLDGAYNRVSKKSYSLLNQMLLSHNGEYATFKQWSELGGKIKKGEKSEIVVFWKMLKTTEEKSNGEKKEKLIPLLRYYNVFHISQVENVEPLKTKKVNSFESIDEAEKLIHNYIDREGITFNECIGDKAFYKPSEDYIQVPGKKQFKDIAEYYSTVFHEMVHSTGSESRLKRDIKNQFGNELYSKEELVAETGSAMILNILGIENNKSFKNSVAYLQNWIKVLKNDTKFIVSASGKAEKAVKYIQDGTIETYNEKSA